MNNLEDINKTTEEDIAYAVLKGTIGSMPILGSVASEVFGLVVASPLEIRKNKWMDEVALKLKELEQRKIIDLEELKNNDSFIDVILQASSYALKTSEQEKIKAFQNAIINTATGYSTDKTINQIFLNQLDNFTIWHIKILNLVDNPTLGYQKVAKTVLEPSEISTLDVIIAVFPELEKKQYLIEIIWNDLTAVNFVTQSRINAKTIKTGALKIRTTAIGRQFLDFITKQHK